MLQVQNRAIKLVVEVVLWLITAFWFLPILLMLVNSFKGDGLDNYKATIQLPLFSNFIVNSAIIAVCMVALSLVIVAFAGFAFSKLEFAGRNLMFYLMVAGLMLPVSSMVVPLFQTVKALHLLNTYVALIGPETAFFLPFGLMLVKNFFDTIPNELMEAATIDGANTFQIFGKIITPLARPALVTAGVFAFLATWNEYFMPLIFISDNAMGTVTLAPAYFQQAHGTDTSKLFASLVLISLPTMIFYIFTQKYLQAGMGEGAIK
jgi:raffinose/stachyose/melibiose transport system permease protein